LWRHAVVAPFQPRRSRTAAGLIGAALREAKRPWGARRWRAGPRRVAPRRARGGASAPVVPDSSGEKDEEDEGLVGKLTTWSNWAEEGWRGVVGVRGLELRRGLRGPAMAGSIPARKRLNRARGGAVELRGKAREVGV
jgi:hypothetical protein